MNSDTRISRFPRGTHRPNLHRRNLQTERDQNLQEALERRLGTERLQSLLNQRCCSAWFVYHLQPEPTITNNVRSRIRRHIFPGSSFLTVNGTGARLDPHPTEPGNIFIYRAKVISGFRCSLQLFGWKNRYDGCARACPSWSTRSLIRLVGRTTRRPLARGATQARQETVDVVGQTKRKISFALWVCSSR